MIHISHALFVGLVVLGLPAVPASRFRDREWVSNIRFRSPHLLAIAIVIAESLMGMVCPLTEWEYQTRVASGTDLPHLIHLALAARIQYYDLEPLVFSVPYTAFGLLAVFFW